MQRKTYFIFCFFIYFSTTATAQVYLQIEKYGSARTRKLPIGTTITFRLKGEKEPWRTEKIEALYPKENIILTPNGMINIEKIAAFQQTRALPKVLGNKFMQFGAAWVLYGAIGHLVGYRYDKRDAIVVGSAIGGGFILKKTLSKYQLRFNKKHRLRIVDLSFK